MFSMRAFWISFLSFSLTASQWEDVCSSRVRFLTDEMIRVWSGTGVPTDGYMQSPDAKFPPVTVTKQKDQWCTKKICLQCESGSGLSFQRVGPSETLLIEKETVVKAYKDFRNMTSYQISQSWNILDESAGLYGGGGYQNAIVNYRNTPLNMIQFNTEAVVPFFVSTAGFGMLWHNYGQTRLNPCDEDISWDKSGILKYTAKYDGLHSISVAGKTDASFGAPAFNITVNGERIQTFFRNTPNEVSQRYEMKAGETYSIQIETSDTPSVCVRWPTHTEFSLSSEASDFGAVDYYLMFGEKIDDQVAQYRLLTGSAPMYGKWAYGFWQCREHYNSQDEVLNAMKGYRDRKIPMDNIVQDWLYWGNLGWGPHWDFTKYPDPASMVKQLHGNHTQLMVSVWAKFDSKTEFYNEMALHNFLISQTVQGDQKYYDPWNPSARELYYQFINTSMFSIDVDAIWLDATEPEGLPNLDHEIFLGSGNVHLNAFSLVTSKAVFEGFAKDYPNKRLFVLTRSSFAGQQRYMATLWSGDTTSSWPTLQRQISSSINFALSGMPYWSQDIGGFFRPDKHGDTQHDQYHDPDYREMLTRWFQFGAFTPIYRVHGGGSHTEIWNYGNETEANILLMHNLRYRLLPYIYSLGFLTTLNGYTMQRHLVFDFPEDMNVLNIADQFMFGPAFLVAPIYTPGGARTVYLPPTKGDWYDFFTGKQSPNGTFATESSLQTFPLFVRAGSIVPMSDVQEWFNQLQDSALTVRVYPGCDSKFTLYDDDGITRDYEEGKYSTISFTWDDAKSELTVDTSIKVELNLVLVNGSHGAGIHRTKPDFTIETLQGTLCINLKTGKSC